MKRKLAISAIVVSFILQLIAGAVPIFIESKPPVNKEIFIPESYGVIEKSSLDQYLSNRLIVLLKDAHCNYDAQHNIARILEVLVRDYKIDLVAIEGATGLLEYARFWEFTNESGREKMADTFVRKGILTGPEYLTITKDGKLTFNVYGIENEKLYIENFETFRMTIEHLEETQLFVNEISRIVKNLKIKLYPKELLEFDNKSLQYHENEISLTDWVKELNAMAGRKGIFLKEYPNILLALDAIAVEETVDFKKVETERAEAISDFEKTLAQENIKEMVEKSLQFRLGKISSNSYYRYIEELLSSGNNNASITYSNLIKYIQLVKLQNWINNGALFNEIGDLEDRIKVVMFQNGIHRQLDDVSKRTRILNGLFKLTLSRDDLSYYDNNKSIFMPSSILSFINIQAVSNDIPVSMLLSNEDFLDKVSVVIAEGEKFYDIAQERDVSLVENTLQIMEEKKKPSAIMVIGGFHTDGVLNLFEKRGVGYVVITPKIVKAEKEGLYLSLMMDKRINTKETTADNASGMPEGSISAVLARGVGGVRRANGDPKDCPLTSSLAFPRLLADGGNVARIIVPLGAEGWRKELLSLAVQVYHRFIGGALAEEKAVMPFIVTPKTDGTVSVTKNPDYTDTEISDMVFEWFRRGLEEVMSAREDLAEFISKPENTERYLGKAAVIEYRLRTGHTLDEGMLRNATLGFMQFYLELCKLYEEKGWLGVRQKMHEIRGEFLPKPISEEEFGRDNKWPRLKKELVVKLKDRGIDVEILRGIVNYLFNMPAYGVDEKGEFYQTLFFNSYLRLAKDIFGAEKDTALQRLLDRIQAYRFLQVYLAKLYKVENVEPVLDTDDIGKILEAKRPKEEEKAKRAEVLARYLAGEDFPEHRGILEKIVSRKLPEWRDMQWVKVAGGITAINEGAATDPTKRDVYVATLTRAGLIDELAASDKYGRGKERFEEELPSVSEVLEKLQNRTFVHDVSMYLGEVEELEPGKYRYSDLGMSAIGLLRAIQLSKNNNQYFICETDIQREAMKAYLGRYGITVVDSQFVKLQEYKNIQREGRIVVTMVSDKIKDRITAIEKDRLLIGNTEGSDLMLMGRLALVIAEPDDIEREKARVEEDVKGLLRRYYLGTKGEKELEGLLKNISIEKGIFRIILPPITPFVKEYYDSLMRAREVIAKAA